MRVDEWFRRLQGEDSKMTGGTKMGDLSDTALIVDDEKLVQYVLAKHLNQLGASPSIV